MLKYHYVYRITNTQENKHYYGTRSSNCLPKDDLGIKYFSSSTDKEFIQDQKSNPQDYKYKVIRITETRKEALNLEIKLHSKFNVSVNESFYNKARQTSTGFATTGFSTARDKNGRTYCVSKEVFDNTPELVGVTKGMVCAKTLQGVEVFITKREFDIREDLVGRTKGVKELPANTIKRIAKSTESRISNSPVHYVYDKYDSLMFTYQGNLRYICQLYDMPYDAFYDSARHNRPLYIKHKSPVKNPYYRYAGWNVSLTKRQ